MGKIKDKGQKSQVSGKAYVSTISTGREREKVKKKKTLEDPARASS